MRASVFLASSLLLLAGCTSDPAFDETAESQAMERGTALAQASAQALMGRLAAAMEEGGPAHAVTYCNVAALPLVDSLGRSHGARIKRTSERLRAPHDAPDALELEWLRRFAEEHADVDRQPRPSVVAMGRDSIAFHAPIFIASDMCLICHGGDARDAEAYARILELYPEDEAIGYAKGDLRGMWSIRWAR